MDERGIVDQSALRMREGTFAAGVWLTYVVVASAALYVSLTWARPHRAAITVLFGVGLAGAFAISRLPRAQIVRSAWREQFFLAWSVLDLGLIVASVALDGGTGSPLALVLFVPVVFAAMSYPLASVVLVGALTMASYVALSVALGGAPLSYELLFTAMLFCTGAMSAWQARNHDHQHQALMDVSRADALTGCLNRRGFEERAVAEIATAARTARQGAVLRAGRRPLQGGQRPARARRRRRAAALDRDHAARGPAPGRRDRAHRRRRVRRAARGHRVRGGARHRRAPDRALGRRQRCSIGLATFPMDGTALEELMRDADARLYASREGGRASAAPPSRSVSAGRRRSRTRSTCA